MAICPFATYRPITANHGGKMSGHIGFVVHVQVGNGSLYGYFDNPATQASSHFWCSKTGTLEQYLDTDITAWTQAAGNANYNSCEFEGYPTEAMTSAQMAQGADLIYWLAGIYHTPIIGPVADGNAGVTPHCNPNGTPDPAWGNHSCPGSVRLAQIPTMVQMAHPVPIKETDMQLYVTNAAGTGFIVAADLSSKAPVVSGNDAAALLATGLYENVPQGKLSEAQINAIPNV